MKLNIPGPYKLLLAFCIFKLIRIKQIKSAQVFIVCSSSFFTVTLFILESFPFLSVRDEFVAIFSYCLHFVKFVCLLCYCHHHSTPLPPAPTPCVLTESVWRYSLLSYCRVRVSRTSCIKKFNSAELRSNLFSKYLISVVLWKKYNLKTFLNILQRLNQE